ncbi:MAG: response regulator [Burkholderiaceae bacterium]|jgi:two-component system invasion response regulator UvrY|nr:response regulator transcription factor [Burkholderiales bacterium]NCV84452.1 DNA-binding response regulator [Oxalobacteraceae bacterium]
MKKTINVMLVDDHAVVRFGFRMLLESTDDIKVVAEAESAEAAYQQIPTAKPDVIVMDISLGGTMGVEATRRIVARDKAAKVLGLSSHEDPSYVRYMLKAGALGYLSKRSAPDELMHAIRQVAEGRMYIEASLSQRMALEEFNGEKSPIEVLSEREFGVFIQLAKGLSVNQIAELLTISPRTVGTHLYNVKQKLGAANQAELTLIAVRHGLIET